MKKTSAFGVALVLLGTAGPLLGADSIRIGTLCLDWPGGFTNERFGDALLLKGPADERVVVSYLRGRNDFSKEERVRFARMHHVFATRTLPDAAAYHGLVVQPLTTIGLANGTIIYSTASQAQHAATDYYYLHTWSSVRLARRCLRCRDMGTPSAKKAASMLCLHRHVGMRLQ